MTMTRHESVQFMLFMKNSYNNPRSDWTWRTAQEFKLPDGFRNIKELKAKITWKD